MCDDSAEAESSRREKAPGIRWRCSLNPVIRLEVWVVSVTIGTWFWWMEAMVQIAVNPSALFMVS